MDIFFSAVLLATFVEGTVEYFFSKQPKVQPYLMYISLVLGVVAAVAYKVDIFAQLGLVSPYPYVGTVATGIVLGRGGNYLNDIISKFRKA